MMTHSVLLYDWEDVKRPMLSPVEISQSLKSAMFLSTFCVPLLLSGCNFYGQMTGKRRCFPLSPSE